jgi:hypothetical protein
MDKLPDYLIEEYIIPFLSTNDLFYKFRSLSSYYYHCARCKILLHFPQEMMKTLKKIIEFNQKEDLTKTFEEVTQKTFTEKRLLLILMLQSNFSLLIKQILENTRDERALRLIAFFYVITKNESKQDLVRQEKYDEIQELAGQEESINEMNDKIKSVVEEDDLDYDLSEYNIVYTSLDEEFLRNNNYTVNLYTFISIFLQYCITKMRFADIKLKLAIFFNQINEASVVWPKKRNFYEKSIDLVADTQLLSNGAKKMLNLFKKYDIENDMTDFNYEKEIIYDFNSIDEYKKIKSNRKKLNGVILRIHQMFAFFIKCINYDIDKDKNLANIDFLQIKTFKVSGHIIPVEEFLYTLSMIKSKFTINEITFFLTRNFLYHNIFHEVYNINPPIKDIIINTIDEKDDKDKEENKHVDGIKSLSLLNANIGDGINNFETILESTKTAGEEINYSFKELSENLEKFNNQLNNHD